MLSEVNLRNNKYSQVFFRIYKFLFTNRIPIQVSKYLLALRLRLCAYAQMYVILLQITKIEDIGGCYIFNDKLSIPHGVTRLGAFQDTQVLVLNISRRFRHQ